MGHANNLSAFGLGVGANVLSSSAWAALAARVSGFTQGLAQSVQVNTALRQSSFVATMIAQFTADYGIADVVDDTNIANFESNFIAALQQVFASLLSTQIYTGDDTGVATALVMTPTQPFNAYAKYQMFLCKIANNIGANATINVDGKGPIPIVHANGSAVQAGEFVAGAVLELIYDGANMQIANVGAYAAVSTATPRIVTTSGAFTTNLTDIAIGLNRLTSPAASSTTLPAGAAVGYKIQYSDLVGNAGQFKVSISPPALQSIAGLPGAAVMNVNRQTLDFEYFGSNLWSVKGLAA